jgi:hypothetical protein
MIACVVVVLSVAAVGGWFVSRPSADEKAVTEITEVTKVTEIKKK